MRHEERRFPKPFWYFHTRPCECSRKSLQQRLCDAFTGEFCSVEFRWMWSVFAVERTRREHIGFILNALPGNKSAKVMVFPTGFSQGGTTLLRGTNTQRCRGNDVIRQQSEVHYATRYNRVSPAASRRQFSAAKAKLRSKVPVVSQPICGVTTTLGRLSSKSVRFGGSFANTPKPAAANCPSRNASVSAT